MKISTVLSLLRDNWMMTESSIQAYADLAKEYLSGNEISTGFFSKLALPNVPDNIALIPINGAMTKSDICGGMGTRSLAAAINQAAADPSKNSIILYFESVPGGQVDGTEVLANAVKAAKDMKPVLSAVSGLMASAGVWVGSQSTEIFATSATDQIGCIGVMAKLRNPATASNDTIDVVSDLSPDKNAEFKDVQILKDMYLNPVAAMFQDAVKEGRGDKLKAGDKVLTGGTFIASEAKKNGLIDGIMPFDKIVKRANYLAKKQNQNTMSATKQNIATAAEFPFKNVLAAAKVEALAPVEEGFAMSEEALTTLDARIVELNTAEASLATANTRITQLEATVAEKETAITALNKTVADYTGKPAPVTADPVVKKDVEPDPKAKYLTSVDEEAAKLAANWE